MFSTDLAVLAHGAARTPSWHAHPDVWLLIAVMAGGYALLVTRVGPRYVEAGEPVVTRLQVVSWSLGVVATWLAADWPIHDVAEGFNYSVHMVQHLVLSMVAAPLLLLGTPAWLLRAVLRPPSAVFRFVRWWSHFLPALVMFNVVLVLTHWPALVDASLRSEPVHFLVHALVFLSALIVWMPVLSPLPEIPRLPPFGRMAFLFLQSIVPTIPASFLTFGSAPLYKFYEDLPHLWGLSTLDDQRLAGLIMKIGAGLLLWMLIATVFFRWFADEERHTAATRRWKDLDRELDRMTGSELTR